LCHTSNISSKGWFIHLFEKKNKVKIQKEKDKIYILNIKKGRQNYLTESDLYSRILFISKLK